MRYEGDIYRPPSEAYSLLVQVTIGCTHNKCRFCSMFKEKKFRVRDIEEVFEDLDWAREHYSSVGRVFLCDGDALALTNRKLVPILERINELFPECERTTIYGNAKDVLHKTPEELEELRKLGVTIIYIGAESGSDKVLKDMCKGATREQLIKAVRMIEDAGIKASVTFISGLGGLDDFEEHALETASMISEMSPSYVGLLTLMVNKRAPMYEDIQSGKFHILTAEEVIKEAMLMMKNINIAPGKTCVFRSNHASNYVSLRGTLPQDKDKLIQTLERAAADTGLLKDERLRMF